MKHKENDKTHNGKFTLDFLDKTPISNLLLMSADKLFFIQNKATFEFEKANYRKQWIDGVIELKYKTTINKFYDKAVDYFNLEPVKEMDKYNQEQMIFEIADIDNPENVIQVEFYRGLSDLFNKPQIKKRISLIKNEFKNTNDTKNIDNKNTNIQQKNPTECLNNKFKGGYDGNK